MKIKRLIPVILSCMLFSVCTSCGGSGGKYRQIGMSEAQELMKSEENYIILDVRTAKEYAGGHIPGAINVANEDIGDEDIPALPNKDQLILVYCRSGRRSKEAAAKLAKLGYMNVVEFGGILDWPGEIETP